MGENMTITLETSRDCHFFLFTLDAEGKLERHYPADNPEFYGDPVLAANVTRVIPANGAAEVGPPIGRNETGVVCSVEPLDKLGLGKDSGPRTGFDGPHNALDRRVEFKMIKCTT